MPLLQKDTGSGSSYVICDPEPRLARASAIIAEVVMKKDPKNFTAVADMGTNITELNALKAENRVTTAKQGVKLHS